MVAASRTASMVVASDWVCFNTASSTLTLCSAVATSISALFAAACAELRPPYALVTVIAALKYRLAAVFWAYATFAMAWFTAMLHSLWSITTEHRRHGPVGPR